MIDKTLKIKEVAGHVLPMLVSAWKISCPSTEKVKEHARNVLFADPMLTSTLIDQRRKSLELFFQNKLLRKQQEEDKVI